MKKMKVLVAALLVVTVVFGGAVPAQAAMSSDVNIEVEETTMDGVSVTVPAVLPIVFNADGTNTLPTNWTIENRSTISRIYLSYVEMASNNSGWALLDESADTTKMLVGTKSIKFYLGTDSNLVLVSPLDIAIGDLGRAIFGREDIMINSGETKTMSFDVKRGAFYESLSSAKAFDMSLYFEFY